MRYRNGMAYEFLPDAEIEAPRSDGEGGEVIEFALGYDVETDQIVVMAVMLTATEQRDVLELHFGIRIRTGDTVTVPDYTKEAADRFIPKLSRVAILSLVKECVESVVRKAMPARIAMETYYPNLPAKALDKYAPIAGGIIVCGYVIGDEWRDQENGKNYWVFSKRDGN